MNSSYLTEFETGLEALSQEPTDAIAGLGVLLRDPVSRRLVEVACAHLELPLEILSEDALDPELLERYELIVAQEEDARHIRSILRQREAREEGINPALIAVRNSVQNQSDDGESKNDTQFDAVLTLPMQPGQVAAQLSLVLYAHRAFAQRYQSAIEELNLNRRIFRSVTSGISVANAELPDLPLTYVNPAFEVMTGYSLEEVQGTNCRFLQRGESDQEGVKLLREAIQQKREVTVILKNFRKDGTSFWNELSLSPIRNRDGNLTHFVGIQTDVTARMEFEAALRQSEKLAAVGRLASSIAHEINNPLESVMNLLFLAQQSSQAAEILSYVARADKEVQRVALITSQSLRFYRQSTKPVEIGCTELLDSVLDLYQARAENSHVVIERRERSKAKLHCLESEIRQVLNNLIRNGIEAMHGHGGRLLVRTRDAVDLHLGTAGVVITIADTGTGISTKDMEQLYKPFFTTKGHAGTGLGLWISGEIVARHLGRFRVRSRQQPEPRGTIFTLFLPVQGTR